MEIKNHILCAACTKNLAHDLTEHRHGTRWKFCSHAEAALSVRLVDGEPYDWVAFRATSEEAARQRINYSVRVETQAAAIEAADVISNAKNRH